MAPDKGLPELFAHSVDVRFIDSVFKLDKLPAPEFPEIAFAGRSNVGKSSLINKIINRRSLVKVSSRPGKTQSLNYFLAAETLYLVDLPGYGYAKVPRRMKFEWQALITDYLQSRETLRCVVVIVDIRHSLKPQDLEIVRWLAGRSLPYLLVYTKSDKLSGNERSRNAAALDAAFGINAGQRVMFSAKTGAGKDKLLQVLDQFIH